MTNVEDLRSALERMDDTEACRLLNILLANDRQFNANYTNFKHAEEMRSGWYEGPNASRIFRPNEVVQFLDTYYPKPVNVL